MVLFSGTLTSKVTLVAVAGNAVAAVVSNEWAIPLNTLLLIVLTVVSRQNGKKIEKTFQSTTHAANAADGAARSAALSTIVASKHLGVDLRDADIEKLTEVLREPSAPPAQNPPPPATPGT